MAFIPPFGVPPTPDATTTKAGKVKQPLTTKGDVQTYSTDITRLGVGTDGQVLKADSGESTGLIWEDPENNYNFIDQSGGTSDTYGALSGTIDGANTTFTVSQSIYSSGSLRVYLNGQLQTQGSSEDWTETTPGSGTFDFDTAPVTGDEITATYGTVSGDADTLDGLHATAFVLDAEKHGPNLLINGDFRVAQRGTSFTSATSPANSDDTYLLDRWILLSDGNDIVDVSQESTTVPTGARNAIKLEVETANKQFGILQILEGKDAAAIIGGTCSLSFQARMGASDDNTHSLKAVVLAWDSTEDTVTSDVVSSWAASPTFVANWTAENTASSNTLTTTYQTFNIENISVDTASTTNVAVFIYCDQTDGVVDDVVYISRVKLENGANATTNVARLYEKELALCERYYEESITAKIYIGDVTNAQSYASTVFYKVYKRVDPTVSVTRVTETNFAGAFSANAGRSDQQKLEVNSTSDATARASFTWTYTSSAEL